MKWTLRYYAKHNKADRERQIPNDSTYLRDLKNKGTNKTGNRFMVARVGGGRQKWVKVIKCTNFQF